MRAAATARNFIFGELLLKRSTERYVKESVGRLSIGKEEDEREKGGVGRTRDLTGYGKSLGGRQTRPGVLYQRSFKRGTGFCSRQATERKHPLAHAPQWRKSSGQLSDTAT